MNRAVILSTPTADVLPGSLITDSCPCYAMTERIRNYYLLKPHILCDLTHRE